MPGGLEHSIIAFWSKWLVHEKWSPQWGVWTHNLSVMSLLSKPLDHGYLPKFDFLTFFQNQNLRNFIVYDFGSKTVFLTNKLTAFEQKFLSKSCTILKLFLINNEQQNYKAKCRKMHFNIFSSGWRFCTSVKRNLWLMLYTTFFCVRKKELNKVKRRNWGKLCLIIFF